MTTLQCLIIVQRYRRDLYDRLRRERKTETVLFDRRQAERRRHDTEPYAGVERRRNARRRAWTTAEQALWSELRYPMIYSGDAGGAAPWTAKGGRQP